jgi:hypothetical protein
VPGNETEDRDAAFRRRIQRFARVEISAGLETVQPRPELVHSAPDEGRLSSRVLRFVHRREAR